MRRAALFFGTLKANAQRKQIMILLRPLLPIVMALSLGLLACTPTPRKVNDAIGRGQPKEAVRLLSDLLNKEGDITTAKLESLLDALTLNRRFTLDAADDLFDRLKPDGKSAILKWYIQVYLERAEKALVKNKFDEARMVWIRHQKVRNGAFPDFQEATPVLGIIDLRECEYWLAQGNRAKARVLFDSARKKLTRRSYFDRVQQFEFANMVQGIERKLNAGKSAKPIVKKNIPRKRPRRGN
jgi:hypothetical protein